jgi:hypothetical protein
MVEFEKVFEPDFRIEQKDQLFKAVRELSEKIGESSGTSTFITMEDALNTGSKIFLIKNEPSKESHVERNFIEV